MNLKTRTMEMIAFVGDDTKETTLKIIKTLKQLGGDNVDVFGTPTEAYIDAIIYLLK
jgi:hypothetical protein